MQRKTTATTVEAREVAQAIGKTRTLASEEEKALRMRHGVGIKVEAPLQRHGADNEELADELLLMEMELMRAWRRHLEMRQQSRTAAQPSRTKDKIVRALRKKH